MIFNERITFSTKGEIQIIDLTNRIKEIVKRSGVQNGLAHIFAPHATGIIVLIENEPNLLKDIKSFLENLIPKQAIYHHPANAHKNINNF